MLKLFDFSAIIMYLLSIKNNKSILKTKKMKNVLFVLIVTLSLIFTSCGTTTKTEETKTTEDSTKVETTTITTPSVDTVKVEK